MTRNEMVEKNLNLVTINYNRYFIEYVQHKEDIMQAGYLGLVYASTTFDKSKNVKFKSWASLKIRSEMIRFCRDWFGRGNVDKTSLSFSFIYNGNFDLTDKSSPEKTALIKLAMEGILENEKKYIKLFYLDGHKLREIAEMENCSEANIHFIMKRGIKKIKKKCLALIFRGNWGNTR